MRVLPAVRFGFTSPFCSYIRSVCGCMPTSSAATLIMYRGRSLSVIAATLETKRCQTPLVTDTRRAASTFPGSSDRLSQLFEQLALLLVHLLRHLDAHAREHVALPVSLQARRASA